MADTTAPEGYERIEWADVRKGDVLFHENGDRLTVDAVSRVGYETCIKAVGLWCAVPSLRDAGFTPYRRKPEMPTQPGPHLDKDGDVWVREDNGTDNTWRCGHDGLLYSDQDVAEYAPFTRLVPMPSSDAVLEVVKRVIPLSRYEAVTDAVMALLSGEGDSE